MYIQNSTLQKDKSMTDKLVYIPNDDTQTCNYWLKRLDTQLYETSNQNSVKVPRVVKPMNKKTVL